MVLNSLVKHIKMTYTEDFPIEIYDIDKCELIFKGTAKEYFNSNLSDICTDGLFIGTKKVWKYNLNGIYRIWI